MRYERLHVIACVTLAAGSVLAAGLLTLAQSPSDYDRLAREIYQELIEFNTVNTSGSTTEAAHAMEARLIAAGYPESDVQVLGPHPNKGNLVARLRSPNASTDPLLLLAHLDVVEALPEDWDAAAVRAQRARWVLLRSRHIRRQGHGGDLGDELHSISP